MYSILKIATLPLVILLGSFLQVCAQQNYVPNGNFDYHNINSCPSAHSQMNHCTGWRQYTYGTSDFFHACGYNVSNGSWGYQQPASGPGLAGGYQYFRGHPHIYKEYIARAITPLLLGGTYEVSISVSLSNNSRFGTDDLGVLFYDVGPFTVATSDVLNKTPQVSYKSYGPIMDTANWVRLTGEFVADSAYDNIVIGGFTHYNSLGLDSNSTNSNYAYYYFDSVVVRLIDSFSVHFTDSFLCAGDTIQVPYYTLKPFPTNNYFTAQLSNASGSFSLPINIGTINSDSTGVITCVIPSNIPTGAGYRMRIISPVDTTYNKPILRIGSGLTTVAATNNGPVCGSDTLKLSVSTTSQPQVVFLWEGPNNFSTSVQNPTIAKPAAAYTGNYIVTATLFGCEAKDTTFAVVLNPFDTAYAVSAGQVCTGDTLQLTAALPLSSLTISWTGPNSFSSTQPNPVIPAVTVNNAGDYVLSITNGGCIVKDTAHVDVYDYPTGVSASSNSPICAGENLLFTASSTSSGVSYTWAGPSGFNSTGVNPYILGAGSGNSGDYVLTASIHSCAVNDTVSATVKLQPAKPVANDPDTLCSGLTANLTASSATTGVSYSWAGPGSYTSSAQNPVINNVNTSMTGMYVVSAILNGCATKDTTSLAVYQSPAPVNLNSNSPICVGNTLQLHSDSSTPGVTYTWTGPAGFNSTNRNTTIPNATTASTGWYKMIVDLFGCYYTDSIYAAVNIVPATPAISHNSPLCAGETLTLNAGTVSGADYSWTGPGNFTSIAQNATRSNVSVNDTGYYKISATIANCTSPADSVYITVRPAPFVVIFPTPGDSICQGDPVTFTALPNNAGGTPQYRWVVNGQTAGGNSTAFTTSTLNNGDIVRCDMTENTKCSAPYTDPSNDISMNVLPWLAPSVTITATPNRPLKPYEYVTFTAATMESGNNPKYQWKRNGQDIVGANGSSWSANTLDDGDSISVEVISDYKCPQPTTAVSNGIRVKVLTSVENLVAIGDFMLYPNPNNGKFVLKGNVLTDGEFSIEIINPLGQLVYKGSATATDHRLNAEIEIPRPATGIYLLKLFDGVHNGSFTKFRIN